MRSQACRAASCPWCCARLRSWNRREPGDCIGLSGNTLELTLLISRSDGDGCECISLANTLIPCDLFRGVFGYVSLLNVCPRKLPLLTVQISTSVRCLLDEPRPQVDTRGQRECLSPHHLTGFRLIVPAHLCSGLDRCGFKFLAGTNHGE